MSRKTRKKEAIWPERKPATWFQVFIAALMSGLVLVGPALAQPVQGDNTGLGPISGTTGTFTGVVSGSRYTCTATATGPCYDAPTLTTGQYVYKFPGTNNGFFMSASDTVLNLNIGGASTLTISSNGLSTPGAAMDITSGRSFITNSGTGGVAVTGAGGVYQMTRMFATNTAPTIGTAGTSPSVLSANGTLSFRVDVGTGGTASAFTMTFPAATTRWVCKCQNVTTNTTVNTIIQTGDSTTTCVMSQRVVATNAAAVFAAGDDVDCTAIPH